MPLTPFSGTLEMRRAAHLLRRATFGPRKEDIDTFAGKTAAEAVALLFNNASSLPIPEAPIDPKTGTEWAMSGTTDANSGEGELQEYFKGWFIAQMLGGGITDNATALRYIAREKVVFFIHTVLTAINSKIDSSRALYFQNQLFRMFALDKDAGVKFNFKELTKKISVDNGMLRLLDGNLNVNGSPNENYARELLELYTIGRGLDGHVPTTSEPGDYFVYKELDVQQAARVLSGWDFSLDSKVKIDTDFTHIDPDTLLPRGKVKGGPTNASAHDNKPKIFSDRFNGQTIERPTDQILFPGTGPTEASALEEISQLIDMIYTKRETAMNICRRIYRFYVYHEITEDIDNNIVSSLADTFIANGFKLQPVLEELFMSKHFYDAEGGVTDDNFGAIIRSPLDLMLGTYRLFDISLPDYKTGSEDFYARTQTMINTLGIMGMNFYEPYDVAGYDAYHQYPIFHRAWISTNYLTQRYAFIRDLISPKDMDDANAPRLDAYQFVYNKIDFARAANIDLLIEDMTKYLLPLSTKVTELTEKRVNYFRAVFVEALKIYPDPEAAWADLWLNKKEVEVTIGQLNLLCNTMLQTPEYQLY